jgi:hypothetical protein
MAMENRHGTADKRGKYNVTSTTAVVASAAANRLPRQVVAGIEVGI